METANFKKEYDARLQSLMFRDLSWDTFRSDICHMYHFDGDFNFISKVMHFDLVRYYWEKREYAKSLYVLAMIDYISWKNKVPYFEDYQEFRNQKLEKILYPSEIVLDDEIFHNDEQKRKSWEICNNDVCGRFFTRHNIVEMNIEDVC